MNIEQLINAAWEEEIKCRWRGISANEEFNSVDKAKNFMEAYKSLKEYKELSLQKIKELQ